MNFYQQKNYQEVDYPFEILHKTKEVFTWGDLRENSLTPIQKKIFSQAREHSICSGIAMSFKTSCPLEGFTLATSSPERKVINYNNLISKDMIFIQLLFHQVLSSSPRLSFSYLDPFLTHLKENHQTRMKHFAASLSLLESLDFFLKQAILPTKVKCLTQELLETLRSNLIDLLSF